MSAAAKLTPRICGRGHHLLRMAASQDVVSIRSVADIEAFRPVVDNGYARVVSFGRFTATPEGRDYLAKLARVW